MMFERILSMPISGGCYVFLRNHFADRSGRHLGSCAFKEALQKQRRISYTMQMYSMHFNTVSPKRYRRAFNLPFR